MRTATLRRGEAVLQLPPGARCIAYVRVSTERQAGETKVSPETQLNACRQYAEEHGYAVDHVVQDEESGAHLERLDRLRDACKAHRLPVGARGLIVYYNASRWGRFEDHRYALMYRMEFNRLGWDVRSATEPNDELGFGELGQDLGSSNYRKQLRQAVIDNMPKVAAQGYWQGRAPFGYAVATVEGGRHKLIPGAARDVATVRRIFKRFLDGASLLTIATELNADHVPGPFDVYRTQRHRKDTRWTSSALRSILKNEIGRAHV